MENREQGYYWIKQYDRWECALYVFKDFWFGGQSGYYWELVGVDDYYTDLDFDEIDERRIINPNEK